MDTRPAAELTEETSAEVPRAGDWPGLRVFPGNYVWHLAANIALSTGGNAAEIVQIADALQVTSSRGDYGAAAFSAWCDAADRLVRRAGAELEAHHELTAGDLLFRASVYYLAAERMQARHSPLRLPAYEKGLTAFSDGVRLAKRDCERAEIPYGTGHLPAYFVRAAGDVQPAPAMVLLNGLDSTKEMVFGSGVAQQLARRGISSVIVDHPGSGEALRLRGMTGGHDSESWAGPVVDYLQTRRDVDGARIGVGGWSLGGYYAPRAAAFEKRLKLCVAWGANPAWGELQQRRLAGEGDRPVPHYWDHVQWVFGKDSLEDFMAWAPQMTLDGVIERITVPLLILHGAEDSQIPLDHAHWMYDHAINSPGRSLKVFTREEGGTMHCSADNIGVATSFISDWVADTL